MITDKEIKHFEAELNDFDTLTRSNALNELLELDRTQKVLIGEPTPEHNLHCHTFYSYSGYGFSPSAIAWLARKNGWFAAGIVDFDVLDGVEEFLNAAEKFNLRGVCGMETRVFIRDLATVEINSPGEPGIAYHMGAGFGLRPIPESQRDFAAKLSSGAAERTRNIVDRVNALLAPIALDFDRDVVPLTPNGNATERHVCTAYRRKAEEFFVDNSERAAFWREKLGLDEKQAASLINDSVGLEGLIRSKTMKQGGVGYVKPNPDSFPSLEKMNAFTLACGALPAIAWLNGESPGERDPGALLDLHLQHGAKVLNIIPDRNWNFADSHVKSEKIAALNRVIAAAAERDMPVIVGTEMNAPGLKLVDDFDCPALAPHLERFVDGAALVFAHTLLAELDMGYLSEWANVNLPKVAEKNQFYARFGRNCTPLQFKKLPKAELKQMNPTKILRMTERG